MLTNKEKADFILKCYKYKRMNIKDFSNKLDKTGRLYKLWQDSYCAIYSDEYDSNMILFINITYKLLKNDNSGEIRLKK